MGTAARGLWELQVPTNTAAPATILLLLRDMRVCLFGHGLWPFVLTIQAFVSAQLLKSEGSVGPGTKANLLLMRLKGANGVLEAPVQPYAVGNIVEGNVEQ